MAWFVLPISSSQGSLVLIGRAGSYGDDPKLGIHDPADNGIPALPGASNRHPGIAVYRRHTLGGYWRVRAPNGRVRVVRQTDLGPSPGTGRVIDVNAVAARKLFGYRGGNAFPTDQGRWRLKYLGKRKPIAPQDRVVKSTAPRPTASTGPSARQRLLQSYLSQRGNPSALLSLAIQARR